MTKKYTLPNEVMDGLRLIGSGKIFTRVFEFSNLPRKDLYQCVLSIYLDSSNLEEMLSGLWVLSTSVGGTGSFSAPTVTHSMSESAHKTQSISSKSRKTKKVPTPTRRKAFLRNYGKQKKYQRPLDTNLHSPALALAGVFV